MNRRPDWDNQFAETEYERNERQRRRRLENRAEKASNYAVERKIVTRNICPPIPLRQFDWCAYYDGEEEKGGYGYGRTEQEAIDDLLNNYEATA